MRSKIKRLDFQVLSRAYQRLATSSVARAVKMLLMLAALSFMVWSLALGIRDLHARSATLDLGILAIGLVFVLIASLLGSIVWYTVVRAFNLSYTWRSTVVIHMTSNAAKYIPGYGWHYVSKGYFLGEVNSRKQHVVLIVISELLVLMSSGVALGLFVTLVYSLSPFGWLIPGYWLVALLTAVGAATIGWFGFVYRRFFVANPNDKRWQLRAIFWSSAAWVAAAVGWLSFAAATLMFIMALDHSATTTYAESLMALTFSSIVSLLVIFVPAGLGVREVTMAALLAPSLPLALGATTSIMLRLAVIVCEFLQLGLVFLWAKHWPQNLRKMLFPEESQGNTPNGVL
jgi:uncharacterized membrane protein YbhN (UPF0104 family)